jgi:peptide/nickel transport system substrate-binding protein
MPTRRRILQAAAALALPSVALPSVARGEGAQVLTVVPQADLAVLDPVWTTTYQTRDHGFLVFDTLYGLDSGFRALPQMAAGAVSEADGKTWRITLRDGLLFHDGAKVLGRDAAASIRRWGRGTGSASRCWRPATRSPRPTTRRFCFA